MASYTVEELFVEFMEDRIEENPTEAHPPVSEGGLIMFANTGDAKIDAWEKKLASGERLSIGDFDDPAIQAWLKPKSKGKKGAPSSVAVEPVVDTTPGRPRLDLDKMMDDLEAGIHDDFTGG